MRHEVEAKTHKLAIDQTNVDLLQTVQEQRDSLLKDLARSREDIEALQMQVDQRDREFMGKLGDTNSVERKLQEELHKARSGNQNSELKIQSLKGEMTSNARDILQLKNHSVTLEQLLSVKEDVYSQLQAANKLAEVRETEASLGRGQMAAASKVIEAQEEKIFETGKCLIYLKNALTENQDYIINLKKLILELKTRSQTYIPLPDDKIDLTIAEFINGSNDPTKLTRLFMRESSGVYQFGTRRLYVKMEGTKIFIRVGGGYLTLEQFLRENVNVELERMANTDPFTVLSKSIGNFFLTKMKLCPRCSLGGRSMKKLRKLCQ